MDYSYDRGKPEARVATLKLRATDPSGRVGGTSHPIAAYTYDGSGRLSKVTDPRTAGGLPTSYGYDAEGRLATYTPAGKVPWRFSYRAIDGDAGNGRIRTVSRLDPSGVDAVSTVVYNVPLTGVGAPHDMSPATVRSWGQEDLLRTATAVFPPGRSVPETGPPNSYAGASISYLGLHGKSVEVADPLGKISSTTYDRRGNVVRELTARNRERALSAGSGSAERSAELDTQYRYADNHVDLAERSGLSGPSGGPTAPRCSRERVNGFSTTKTNPAVPRSRATSTL